MRPKSRKKFAEQINAYLETIGAIVVSESPFGKKYELNTIGGKIRIQPCCDESALCNVYCVFDDPTLAGLKLGADHRLNTYSGKYNFHFSDELEAYDTFVRAIERIRH